LKLLFDHNLSPRLVRALADVFPESQHVFALGMDRGEDGSIWDYAKANGFTIVSKDADFIHRSFLYGFPPKVIYLELGNCPTRAVEQTLRDNLDLIREFESSEEKSCLTLPPTPEKS
jgi:predicted nuclease of predicted toxin-antitoxin system